jgi:Ca-activated chloride channel family protein
MHQLDGTPLSRDQINRIILLSDGEPTDGVKDVTGFRAMATRMRDKGFAVSTIGVDTKYEEKIMSSIAEDSNGMHFFVANPSGLPAVFDREFASMVASVASDSELVVELAPGVEVEEVFDRSFRREVGRVIIPFGTFSAQEEKTVLMKVRVPADHDGKQAVADVKLGYRDVALRADARTSGSLALLVASDGTEQKALDPFVEARVERTRTAAVLRETNKLVEEGKLKEARIALDKQKRELVRAANSAALAAPTAAPKPVGRGFKGDFEEQEKTLATAQAAIGASPQSPPPAPTTTARVAKENVENSTNLRR